MTIYTSSMGNKDYNSARKSFEHASKEAIKEYIKVIGKGIAEDTGSEKIKSFIEAKVEAVEGCKEALRAIQNEATQKYMKETVGSLMDAMWEAYEITLDGLEEPIEDDLADNKVKVSVQGKRKSFENSKILIDSIKEVEEMMQNEEIVIKESKAFKKKTIESRAKNV